eukprot:m.268448 g.268448  ORF g.268448 m.268448 type:complete len:74 (+) comp40528_c0_seq3:1165-1386(+)
MRDGFKTLNFQDTLVECEDSCKLFLCYSELQQLTAEKLWRMFEVEYTKDTPELKRQEEATYMFLFDLLEDIEA